MKAFLYERVSSEEQARHGYSLDAQHDALLQYCEANDHTILGEYRDEGISGRKPYTKRPAMVQLLRDVEIIKPDIILFTKLDRWFRNIKEYYKVQDILDRNNVAWNAINEDYDTNTASGRLYVNIKLSIAQDEADRTSERIKDIQDQQVAQGKVLGGSVPFGYAIKDKRVVFGDNISITKEAIDHYLLHQSAHETVRYINDLHGLNMTHTHLLRLFRSPILKGEYRANTAYCEPLISSETWDKLQETMQRNVKHASKRRTYIFSGLIRCPVCGRKLGGCYSDLKYYRCAYRYYGYCESHNNISEKKLETWLLENIEDDFRINVTMKPKEKQESPQKYKDRLTRLNDVYVAGNISKEEYTAKSADLQRKIAELKRVKQPKTVTFSENWRDTYQKLDEEHRRLFWRGLIKGVELNDDYTPKSIVY